jgi:Leucine-rich repeat (LRR) protein
MLYPAGTLPNDWSLDASTSLTTIDLSNNSLSGTLPTSWASLHTLQWLDLSHNQLEGQLPAEWGNGLQMLSTM